MRFILSTDALSHIGTLGERYNKQKVVKWTTAVKTREAQISFLEKMHEILKANLLPEEEIQTPEQWQANLTASRVMLAACLYVQSQVRYPQKNSVLYCLINETLGVSKQNNLDTEDKELCNLVANRLVNSSQINLDDANLALRKAKMSVFTELEWKAFSDFLKSACSATKEKNPYTQFPFTSIAQPLIGTAFSYTGASIGHLMGRTISNSTKGMETRYKLTTFVGGSLLVLGPVGPTSFAIIAPIIAGELVNTFCSISLARIMGISMGLLGQGIGMSVGLPLDLAYHLIWNACSLISNRYSKNNIPILTGLRIGDGMSVINGLEFKMIPEDELLTKEYKTLEIKEDGQVYLNEEPLEKALSIDYVPEAIEEKENEEQDECIDLSFFDKEPLLSDSIAHNDLFIA
jgi:hypothetical protein